MSKFDDLIVKTIENNFNDSVVDIKYSMGNHNNSRYLVESGDVYFMDDNVIIDTNGKATVHLTDVFNYDCLNNIGDEIHKIYENFENENEMGAKEAIDEVWNKIKNAEDEIIVEAEDVIYETFEMMDYNLSLSMRLYRVKTMVNNVDVNYVEFYDFMKEVAPNVHYGCSYGDISISLVGFNRETLVDYIW